MRKRKKSINKRKLIILIFAVLVVASIITFILKHKNSTKTVYSSEFARASSYNEITDNDYNIDNCEYVKFSSFFIRDLDGDGYAEKYDGTVNHLSKSATLYFDINVLTDGTLKNGKITIGGQNFTLNTALVKDSVLKNDYIGTNITSIELNDISYGTQKLFFGKIVANIGNNINNYSREDNTITLTGTWVSTDGTQSKEINKVVNLTTDWYGITKTSYYSNAVSTSHYIDSCINGDNITLNFNVSYRETAEQLLIQKQITELDIPELNGYEATSVTVNTQNCIYSYDTFDKKLTIERNSQVDGSGNITSSVSRINTYSISVTYPLEAYESLGTDSFSLTIPTTGYYYGYNNSSEEYEDENPYISSSNHTMIHTWRIYVEPSTTTSYSFRTYVGKYVYNPDTSSYRYVISKHKPLLLYNGIEEETSNDEYIVQWRAYTGINTINGKGLYLAETESDKFLNSSAQYDSMYNYIKTKGIYFSGADSILQEEGYIKIYDGETDALVETFTKDNWGSYSESNPYYFSAELKSIKVETSSVNDGGYFYVYQIKEIDDSTLVSNYTYDEFEALEYIYTYLNANLIENSSITHVSNVSNYAYYEAPVSIVSFDVEPTTITNQETKTLGMTITTKTSNYNEELWQNGEFVIEFPSEILLLDINNVTSSNFEVDIVSYEIYEENGKQYIKIYTSNDTPTTYSIIVSAEVTADPREPTVTSRPIELYAINEYNNYYRETSRASDILDINGNGNTEEYVANHTESIAIIAPSSLNTSQTLTDFDDDETEVVSPQIAILDKSDNSRTATIKQNITNNYNGTISDVIIVGKIPFEGNTYQINGRELGSTYSTTMSSSGVALPTELQGIATVYYSDQEEVTNNIALSTNNWKTANQVTNWPDIKTYLIDLSSYTLSQRETLEFSYEINLPANVAYNQVAYSTHAVYFSLDTEDGKLRTRTEVNKLGIMIAKKYNLSLTKYKESTDKTVDGATYKVTDGTNVKTAVTNNGVALFKDLYIDKTYTLKELLSPSSYELNSDEVVFTVTVDTSGDPVFNLTSGTLKGGASFTTNESKPVLNLAVEDTPKYDVQITKQSSLGSNLKGVKFKLLGGIYGTTGRVFTSNASGLISISNLSLGTEYTLIEIKADGYYIDQDATTFTLTRNSSGNIVVTSSSSNFTNGTVTETSLMDKPILTVTISDEAIPTYSLNINKKNDQNENLQGTQFKLTSVDTGNIEYGTTDENGNLVFTGLYEYVSGKYVTGEYILQETLATKGYITNNEQTRFKAESDGTTLNITVIEGGSGILSSSSDSSNIYLNYGNDPVFKLTKKGDNDELLEGAEFTIKDVEADDYAKDVNGNYIGEEVGMAGFSLDFTSSGTYVWTQNSDDDVWVSGNKAISSSSSTLTSDTFVLPEEGTLSFDWSVSCQTSSGTDYLYYKITNLITGAIIGGNTTSTRIYGTSRGTVYSSLSYDTKEISLDAGTYKLEFTYYKNASTNTGLDSGYVKNARVTGSGYYKLVTNEEGEITANLPGGLYKVTEIAVPEGYELDENEGNRTNYFGIGDSREEERDLSIEWAKSITGNGFAKISDVKPTSDGGYVVVGSFEGSTDFNSDGTVDEVSNGSFDGVIAKYSSTGTMEWYTPYGSEAEDEFYSVDNTIDGGYIAVGYTTSDTYEDGLIVKYDSSGTKVWEKTLEGNLTDEIRDVKVLSNGNIAVAGRFKSTTLPLDGSNLLTNGRSSGLCFDGFVAVYDSTGNYIWSDLLTSTATAYKNSIDATSVTETSQGVVISANFVGALNLGTSGVSITNSGSMDTVLISYTSAGAYSWYQKIGGSSDEAIEDITTDEEDNIIGVGCFSSSLTLGEDTLTVSSTSYASALEVKYSPFGEYISSYTFGNTVNYDDKLMSVYPCTDGGVLLGGFFYSTVDVDKDGTNDYTGSTSYSAGIIVKLNDEGEYQYSRNIQGSIYDSVYGVAELTDGGAVACGNFNSSTISSGTDSNILSVEGNYDSFMVKFANIVTAAEIPELQEIEVTNKLKKYEITTVIDENSDGERTGGTITGNATEIENVNLVENVKYNYDSLQTIVITPSANYSVYKILVDGEEIEFTPDATTGVVTIPVFEEVTGNHRVIVTFEKDLSSVIVHHYLKDREGNYTTTSVAEDDYVTGKIGDTYNTSPKIDLDGYSLEKNEGEYVIPANATGEFGSSQIEVTYYYEETSYYLTVNHYLDGTEDALVPSEVISLYSGDPYTTSSNSSLLEGDYVLVEDATLITPEENGTSGTITSNITVNYYYKLKEYKITTEVQTHTETDLLGDEIQVEGGTISGKSDNPYETVIIHNDSTKDIVITADTGYVIKSIKIQTIDDENNSTEEQVEIASNLTTYTMSNFTALTANKNIIVEFQKLQGTVTVHHYIEGTTNPVILADNSEAQSEIKTGDVGDGYATRALTNLKSGYSLLQEPENSSGYYTQEPITVIYYYTYEIESADFVVTKTWDDNNNSLGLRPSSISVTLSAEADGEEYEIPNTVETTATLNSTQGTTNGNNWTYTWESLAKYTSEGDEITYSVTENTLGTELDRVYTPSYEENTDGIEITNTYSVPTDKIEITVNKVWAGENGNTSKRPDSIKFVINNGSTNVSEYSLNLASETSHTFELDKFDSSGNEISYSVDEEISSIFYSKSIGTLTSTGTDTYSVDVTNTFAVPDTKVEVYVNKVWSDNSNANNHRPSTLTLKLINDGTGSVEATHELNITNGENSYTFTNLAKYDSNGDEISYSVDEEGDLLYYSKQITQNSTYNYTITNTFAVPTDMVDIEAEKVWDDSNDVAGKRPSSVILILKNGSTEVARATVNAGSNWKYTFNNLAKYDESGRIMYTIDEEEASSGDLYFYTKLAGTLNTTDDTIKITNMFEVPDETINITATKVWDDNSNSREKRQANSIELVLSGNARTYEQSRYTVDSTNSNNWIFEFTDIPKYDLLGDEIDYTLSEEELISGVLDNYVQSVNGFTITNTEIISKNEITKTGTDRISAIDDKVEYALNFEAELSENYIGTSTIEIVDYLPYEIDTSKEYSLNGGIYDSTLKTITWNITGSTEKSISLTKNISLYYKDLDIDELMQEGKITNNVNATITLSNGVEDTAETSFDTEVDFTVNIVANKTWEGDSTSGTRPSSITAKVKILNGDGSTSDVNTVLGTSIVTEKILLNPDWTNSWSGLPKYNSVTYEEINYTVIEKTELSDYYTTISSENNVFNILNSKYGSIEITKVNKADNTEKIGGVEIKLEKLKLDGENWGVDSEFNPVTQTTGTSGENLGKTKFTNLEYGKYRLTEVKSSAEYNLLSDSADVEISASSPDYSGTLQNAKKSILPDTGSSTTIVVIAVGILLILFGMKTRFTRVKFNGKTKNSSRINRITNNVRNQKRMNSSIKKKRKTRIERKSKH